MVPSVLCDRAALARKYTDGALCMSSAPISNRVARVVGRQRDGLAAIVEVVVQVFDFLVAGEEVHGTRASRGGSHVVKVGLDQFVGNIGWDVDVAHGYHVVKFTRR